MHEFNVLIKRKTKEEPHISTIQFCSIGFTVKELFSQQNHSCLKLWGALIAETKELIIAGAAGHGGHAAYKHSQWSHDKNIEKKYPTKKQLQHNTVN